MVQTGQPECCEKRIEAKQNMEENFIESKKIVKRSISDRMPGGKGRP